MNITSSLRLWPLLLLVCASGTAHSQGRNSMPLPRLERVADDVYVIENANATIAELIAYGGNATVILTNAGTVLIDTKVSQMVDHIIDHVRSLTDSPVTHVILTHNHNDHAGGAARLQETGATTIVSDAIHERIGQGGGGGSELQEYSGELLLKIGGKELHLYEIQGHTGGDTFAYLPQSRVLVAGDLVTTVDSIPVIVNYEDGGSWTGLGAALDRIAEFDFEFLIGGHGPTITKSEFLEFRDKVKGIIERTRTLVREDASRETIASTLLAEFGWGGGLATGNIPLMMQELDSDD